MKLKLFFLNGSRKKKTRKAKSKDSAGEVEG
jgi:hypothetical protein